MILIEMLRGPLNRLLGASGINSSELQYKFDINANSRIIYKIYDSRLTHNIDSHCTFASVIEFIHWLITLSCKSQKDVM